MSRRVRLLAASTAALGLAACAATGPKPPEGGVVDLGQGWSRATADKVHTTPQGTQILPTAWLTSLEEGFLSSRPFLAPPNMRRFGFIVDDVDAAGNRRELDVPLGFAAGTMLPVHPSAPERKVDWTGFTCAACHTGQLEYQGRALRVEGGQAYHDAAAFQNAMGQAILATKLVPGKYRRFRDKAVAAGYPEEFIDENFGHAYEAARTRLNDRLRGKPDLYPVYEGHGRLDALQRIANQLFAEELKVEHNNRSGEAPVSYPYLWDIWLFDWVQYNGSVRQPMIRNVGEALGVRARTNFVDRNGWTNPEPLRWQSSIPIANIHAIEEAYQTLRPPRWPAGVLPRIDEARAAAGKALFERGCAGCHGVKPILDRPVVRPADKQQGFEWHLPVVRLTDIGTDPAAAVAFARNRYDATKLNIAEPLGAADGLRVVTAQVREQAYRDAGVPKAAWPTYDGFGRENLVVATCGYKARPLVGVWATPPFLHNGSVPTLVDLLSEERPASFAWGSREFDPIRVGYVTTPGSGSREFDTTLTGNSNAGHWFTDDRTRPGRLGPALKPEERLAIVEYLKAATPEDYPVKPIRKGEQIPPLPCSDSPGWAGVEVARR